MFRFFAAMAAVVAAAGACRAQPDADSATKELLAIYQKLDAFAAVNDNASAEAYYAPGWTSTAPGEPPKTLAEVQALEAKAGLNGAAAPQKVSRKLMNLKVTNGEVRITFLVTIEVKQKDDAGQFGAAGLTHQITATASVRDAWVQTAEGWKQRSHTRLTQNKIMVDGKPWPAENQ